MPSIDVVLFTTFLVATIVIGLFYGRHVGTLRAYSVGNKDFSTATLTATIAATWLSGTGLFINLEKTYTSGLYFIIPALDLPLNL